MWLPPASYSLVGSEMYSIRQFSAFHSRLQATSGQMTSLPGHFRSPEVTWRHFLPRYCLLLRATALWEVKCTVYASFRPSTAASRWLPVKWRHFRVTSGKLRWRDVISCQVTASSCELQPCRKWNVPYTRVFGLLQPLPGDFRSNNVTSGNFRSPEVKWRDFLARDWLLLRATALWEVKCTVYATFRPSTATSRWLPVKWRHFQVTCGLLRSREVISCQVTASSCELQNCKKWMYCIRPFSAFTSRFQGLPDKWRHFR